MYSPPKAEVTRLKTLSTTLDLANTRSDALIFLARGVGISKLIKKGVVSYDSSPSIAATIRIFMQSFSTWIPVLKDSNHQLQLIVQDIDPVFQGSFNLPNVRMYDIVNDNKLGSCQNFSTFTATTVLVDKLLHFRQYYYQTGGFVMQDINYILMNIASDLMLGTTEAVETIVDYVDFSISEDLAHLNSMIYWVISFAIMYSIVSLIFMWKAYETEVKLFEQYIEVPIKEFQGIQMMLNKFERILDNEDYDGFAGLYNKKEAILKETSSSLISQAKVKRYKKINKRKLQRSFWLKTVLMLTCMLLIIGNTVICAYAVSSKVSDLKQKIQKLNKTQSLQYQIPSIFLCISALFTESESTYVFGKPVIEEFKILLELIFGSINVLLNLFQGSNDSLDSKIWGIMTGDACPLVSASMKQSCSRISSGSKETGMFSLIGVLYSEASKMYESYQSSDKTPEALKDIIFKGMISLPAPTLMIRDLLTIIIGRLRVDLYNNLKEASFRIMAIFSVNLIILVLINLLVFWAVLRHYVEVYNRFKEMIVVLPLRLVLDNSNLKGILIKLSGTRLNAVKNEL